MQIEDAASVLASAEFFGICTDEERRMLAFASERKRYAAGSVILTSGEVPGGAQVLISGSISISPDSNAEPNPYVVSQPGAVISAMALLTERPREVTVKAIGVVETLFVPRNSFLKLVNESPELAKRASSRIRRDLVSFVSAVTPMRKKIKKD